jgi:hypothetical protein
MPTLDDHPSDSVIKLLLLGRSGAGKTGLLGSLAKDYRLFIADFDNGLDILKDPKVVAPEHRKNIFYRTYYDKSTIIGTTLRPSAIGYTNFVTDMGAWKEEGQRTEGIYAWKETDIFIIDSLTFLGNMIMNNTLQLAGRAGQKPQIQDFGTAMDAQEAILETLYNPAVRCNVIVTSHIQYQGDEANASQQKGVPSAIGKKLAPKVPRYFNNVVQVVKSGSGNNVKREILTTATYDIDLKVSKPSKVPPVMEADLGKLFTLLK